MSRWPDSRTVGGGGIEEFPSKADVEIDIGEFALTRDTNEIFVRVD